MTFRSIPFLTAAVVAFAWAFSASAQTVSWQAKGNDALIVFGRPDVSVVALSIGYPRYQCNRPVARVVMMTGNDLGPETKRSEPRGLFSDMIWKVGGRAYGGKALRIDHTNGTEYAMLASSGLLGALSSGRTIELALPKSRPVTIPNPPGFSQALATAKRYFC